MLHSQRDVHSLYFALKIVLHEKRCIYIYVFVDLRTLQHSDRLKDLFSNVDALRGTNSGESDVDEQAAGLCLTPSQRSDNNIVEDVSNTFL